MVKRDPILCFVREPWAYFTTQALDKQWGDDWNDAPYEHNAGNPYLPQRAGENWRIVRIVYDGPIETPSSYALNSAYSVEQINARAVPWLKSDRYVGRTPPVEIWAGETISEVIKKIRLAGGKVWLPEAE